YRSFHPAHDESPLRSHVKLILRHCKTNCRRRCVIQSTRITVSRSTRSTGGEIRMGGAAGAWRRNLFGWLGAGANPGAGITPAPAGLRARSRAEDCRGGVAPSRTDLMPEHAPDDAARDETRARTLALLLDVAH